MKDAVSFVLGAVILVGVLSMLREDTAKRIRNSNFWVVGWLGYLLGLAVAARLMMPEFDRLPIDDEVAVPLLMASVFLITTVLLISKMRRLRPQRR
jgi:hypothetical protein